MSIRSTCLIAFLFLGALTAPAAAQPTPPQPANLAAFQRSGQTFLTWTEVAGLNGEAYHIYRHTAPITAATLAQATQLTATWGPLGEGSSAFHSDRERGGGGSTYPSLHNYVIDDLGPQLSDETGLFVWTTAGTGDFYYAVTTVHGGVENRTSFSAANSLASPVAETVADPLPVLVWQSPSGRGRVYTQFLDLAGYNPTFGAAGEQDYVYAYNYALLQPDPANCPGETLPASLPLSLYLQGWGGRYEVDDASPYWCAVALNGDDPWQTWYYGHSASYDYRQEDAFADSGPIVNFSEQRLLRAIYDTLRSPAVAIDPQRVFVYGQSMGGSGALALGLRYPNVFAAAHAGEPMTNFRTAGDGGGVDWRGDVDWKWGSTAANLPIQNRGRYAGHLAAYDGLGVWNWQNHQAQLSGRRADDTAFISLDHGTLDTVLEWTTQGRPAYQPFYLSRRPFSGATVDADHTWLGFAGLGPTMADVNWTGPFYGFQAVRDETLPGLTYGSGSAAVPPSGPAEYNHTLEWSASWNAWDGPPLDTPALWRISLRTTDGSDQTVDVTPRRLQAFVVTPGAAYTWENRRVSDNGLEAAGQVYADADGLVTAPAFAVSPGGNRLILQPASGSTATPTPTASATPSQTPTPSRTPTASASPTNTAGATATPTRTATVTPTATATAEDACPADLNGDGLVDLADILLAAAGWGLAQGQPGFDPALDLNHDGVVNVVDVQLVAARFNLTCAEVTPTPTRTPTATHTPPAGAPRPWPDSSQRIQVFNDQLASWMTDDQLHFAATHYAGTQKMTRSQADALRAVNPVFLILHYRLGHGLGYRAVEPPCQPSGDWLQIIDGDWVQEWPGEAALDEPWFYHWPEGGAARVLNCDWGWYLMDVSQAGYRSWWISQVLGQLAANDDDGVFADSLSVPNYLGYDRYDPALPAVDAAFEAAWTQRIEDWIAYVQSQLDGRYYFVPNAGAWVNSRDATDYSAADGVMIEGFAEWGPGDPFDLSDWRLQMNRALGLVGQGRSLLAQSYVEPDNVPDRLFQLGAYLLIKSDRTYINFDLGLEPEWFPEYDIDLGAALDPLPAAIDDLRQANGLYRRRYARGEVWLQPDPAAGPVAVSLGATRWLAAPQGGGFVPADGVLPASWQVSYSPLTSITLGPGQAAILLNSPP